MSRWVRSADSLFHVSFIILMIFLLVQFLSVRTSMGEEFYKYTFGEFFVGFGTILLAYFTFRLASVEVRESRRDRRRDHLKERLEFYSLLKGKLSPIFKIYSTRSDVIDSFRIRGQESNIQGRYAIWASDDLKERLEFFYQNIADPSQLPPHITDDVIMAKLEEIVDIVNVEFEQIMEDYRELIEA